MTTALIFAGGTGHRMNSRSKPKQFLEMHGKPIIIYTIEHFEYHEGIEQIVVVCLKDWISELQGLIKRYGITKVRKIVPGGETGHDSIYLGLLAMKDIADADDIVLIHDGVRPLINRELISRNIMAVERYGNAITVEAARESVICSVDGETISQVPNRSQWIAAIIQRQRHENLSLFCAPAPAFCPLLGRQYASLNSMIPRSRWVLSPPWRYVCV